MSKLENLMHYYSLSRRVGHTQLMLEGVNFKRPAIVLAISFSQASELHDRAKEIADESVLCTATKVGEVEFRTIELLNDLDFTLGIDPLNYKPIIVDHFALQYLIQEHERELMKKWKIS